MEAEKSPEQALNRKTEWGGAKIPGILVTQPKGVAKQAKNVTNIEDNKEEFEVISNRAFLSIHIREILNEWEHNQDSPIVLTEAANEVIDNLKFDYPNLKKWSNLEIINRIKLNWTNRDEIQKDLNKKIFERTKSLDLQEREEENPNNII